MVTTHVSSLLSDSADLVSAAGAHWWVWSSKIAFSALGKPGGEDADPQCILVNAWSTLETAASGQRKPPSICSFQPVSPHRTGTLCQALPKAVSVKRYKDPFPASLPFLRAKAASVLLCVSSFSGSGSHSLRKSASHTLPFLHSGSLSPLTFPSDTGLSVSNLKQAQQPVSHRCPAPSSANSLFPLTERFFCEKQITKHVLAFLIHKGVQSH